MEKIFKIEVRPDDGIATATQQFAPIYVSSAVWSGDRRPYGCAWTAESRFAPLKESEEKRNCDPIDEKIRQILRKSEHTL